MTRGLSRRQLAALETLLLSPSVSAAAKASGLGRRTLQRYLADSIFAGELRRRRTEAIAQAGTLLANVTGSAALRLVRQMDEAEDAWLRFTAARTVIDLALRFTEIGDLADRLDQLERRVSERGGGGVAPFRAAAGQRRPA